MINKIFIKDDLGNHVSIDIEKFIKHINIFHRSGVSIHEEGGHYFTVDDSFRKILKEKLKTNDH